MRGFTLTPRRRAVVAVVLSWPLGFFYLDWSVFTGINIIRYYRTGFVDCDDSWREYTNGCEPGTFHPLLSWAELIAVSLLALGVVYLAARWVMGPVRAMAETVERLGPTSLGLRLRTDGPPDETRRLGDAVDAMLDRVAVGYEAQRRFAANASHELRTPLATQRALIEVSLRDALTTEQLELLSRQLLATNERNEHLIEGLLVLAETERGLVTNTPLRLDGLTTDAVELLRPTASAQGIEIIVQVEPVLVRGELPLLERLIGNVVHNAIKYNVTGGWVHVTVRAPAQLEVINPGPVIPADQVGGLFEPFRRLGGDRLDHGGGVGLGLAIARSIVAAHGGSIDAQANDGGGLTVRVDLTAALA
jgi:signal transduction histidine kinase